MYAHKARKKRAKVLLFFEMTKYLGNFFTKKAFLSLLFAYMTKFL